ncbi:FAD-binding oxidoreductase [Chloroflexi bacterium TSY]|nr:FAD-binding oxidoreductase [Chloroflexi bacterium TSY]
MLGFIQPGTRAEVQGCIRIANQFKIPIYPISAGKNWGYGSRVPVATQSVVMSLARLNQIVDHNEKLAYVVIEPGVTFRQLHTFLRQRNSNLMVNSPGSTPDASVIGHLLERGVLQGLEGERWNFICALEVILPTGECIHTGYGRFPMAKGAQISRSAIGPYVDGLFTQSNLGIVTEVTLWLPPLPNYTQTFSFRIESQTKTVALLDALQRLRMEGVIGTSCGLFNDYRIMSFLQQYPWDTEKGQTPLSAGTRQEFQAKLGGEWFGQAGIQAASVPEGRAKAAYVAQQLQGTVDSLRFSKENKPKAFFMGRLRSVLSSVYWRKQKPLPAEMDPDGDGCGVMWISPVVPFDGSQIWECLARISQTMLAHRFEPSMGILAITQRSVYITVAIIYDRTQPGEDEAAINCYHQLMHELNTHGYFPYRLGIQGMQVLPQPNDDSGILYKALKKALDPNDILAPGRYDFRQEWPR